MNQNLQNLFEAITNNDLETVQGLLLLDNVYNHLGTQFNDGLTFLMLACRHGNFNIVQALVENMELHGYYDWLREIRDEDDMTSLWFAVINGNIQIVTYLLDHGSFINNQNSHRQNCLFVVPNANIATLLLDRGIPLNDIDYLGNSALITLIKENIRDEIRFPLIHILIERGADVNIVNGEGKTALQYEMERFYEELRYGDYDKNQLIIDLINHGARSIDYTSSVIRGMIIKGELPNPLNYRDPDNFNPDIIPEGTVTVTLDEIQGANPTVPKKYGIKLLTTLYDNDAHPNINAISWTSDTLRQVNHRVSDQTIYEYLNHFRYFGQSIHDTIFLIHEKTIDPGDPHNATSYYPPSNPNLEICNIYQVQLQYQERLLFGTLIQIGADPTIFKIMGVNPVHYKLVPEPFTGHQITAETAPTINKSEEDLTWTTIERPPKTLPPEFTPDLINSDAITVSGNVLNKQTLLTQLDLKKHSKWVDSTSGNKHILLIQNPGEINPQFENYFNYRFEDDQLYGVLKWDQRETGIPKVFGNLYNGLLDDHYTLTGTPEEEQIRIMNIYHIGLNKKYLVAKWLEKLEIKFPNFRLRNNWETDGYYTVDNNEAVFPTIEEYTTFLTSEPRINQEELNVYLREFGIPIPPPMPTNFGGEVISNCGICMSNKNYNIRDNNNPHRIVVLPCGHTLHKNCIQSWHQTKVEQQVAEFKCPSCNVTYANNPVYEFKPIQLGGYFNKYQKYINKMR
jgi:hypothetical protein